MIPLILELNKALKRVRLLWYGPVILLMFILLTRLFNIPLLNLVVLGAGVLLSKIVIFVLIMDLFTSGTDLKYEVISYKKLGLGVFQQYVLKFVIVLLFSSIFYVLCSFIRWSFNKRGFLIIFSFLMFLFFMRSMSIYFKTRAVYLSGIILIIISVFYPLYVMPNLAYVMHAGTQNAIMYSATYILLYFLAGFSFFVSSWRDQCIGWI